MPEMDAVRADSHGNVNVVVNEELCIKLLRHRPQFLREGKQFPDRQVPLPELYCTHTALKRQPHGIGKRHPCPLAVGNQIEFEINGQNNFPSPQRRGDAEGYILKTIRSFSAPVVSAVSI